MKGKTWSLSINCSRCCMLYSLPFSVICVKLGSGGLAQILSVPWGRVGELPGSKVLLLIASAGIVAYFLFRAARELYSAGEKAFSAFLTLLRVFAKTVPPILLAGLAAAAGAWVVNHVQM